MKPSGNTHQPFLESEIMPRLTAEAMISAYTEALAKIRAAYESLDEAKKELETAFGARYSDFSTIPERSYYSDVSTVVKQVHERIKKSAWKCIIAKMEMRKVMSIKAQEELDKKLDDPESMPELELSAVLDIMGLLAQNRTDYAHDMIEEVYEILMPGRRDYDKYKTNARNGRRALGKKVILTWKVEPDYSGHFRVRYYAQSQVCAIDKAFHILDGKGTPEGYTTPLVDAINTVGGFPGTGETTYFKFRCCANGNLHLEFKRLDLVQRINQIVGSENPSLVD